MAGAKRLAGRIAFTGRFIEVAVDRVELPNGRVAELEVIRHPGAAAVVPLARDGTVRLIRQYRYAPGDWLLEVPAGKLDPGEAPEDCARRELEEEAGYRAGDLAPLGWIWTTPGFTDEKIHLYLARDLAPVSQCLEPDEVLSVVSLPFAEAVEKARRGEICDGKSVCALLRAWDLLERTGGRGGAT